MLEVVTHLNKNYNLSEPDGHCHGQDHSQSRKWVCTDL